MRTLLGLFTFLCSGLLLAQGTSLSATMEAILPDIMPNKTKKIEISVKDMRTRSIIPFFTIDFTSCGHPVYESNEQGIFSMETVEGFACFIRIAKRGFANLDLLVDYEEIPTDGKTFNVFLSRSPNCFSGHLRDTSEGNLYLAEADVELLSITANQVQRVQSNVQGEFSLYLTPNSSYKITVKHPDYHLFTNEFSTGQALDGQEIKRFYLRRMAHKKIPAGLGNEVRVTRKNDKLVGINYYSVQLIAQQSSAVQLEKYEALKEYGELFVDDDGTIAKVKIGKFFDRAVAEKILYKIKEIGGFEDAFLTQFLPANKNREERERRILTREPGYMVRLASYLNAEMFDGTKLEELGHVTSVQQNQWTIMLLEGFSDFDTARQASEQVQELGFKSAHVVKYEGSRLVKVDQ